MAKTKDDDVIIAGGSATAGGMNFQAAVTAIVEVHVGGGVKLGWLEGVAHDLPVSVSAETGGPGDDLEVAFADGSRTEVQVKRGLKASPRLWDAILNLARGLQDKTIEFGVLVVCPNSSASVRNDLARDLMRLSDGRRDGLKDVTTTFLNKLADAGLSIDEVVPRLRIQTVHALTTDSASVSAARVLLTQVCEKASDVDRAWNAIYLDAGRLIEYRAARAADSVARVLRSEGIALRSQGEAPAVVLDALSEWNFRNHGSFPLPGIDHRLDIEKAWISLDAAVVTERPESQSALAEALKQYHSWAEGGRRRGDDMVKAETVGRFIRCGVIIGGPGMGKTTLVSKIARTYAAEGLPVLRFAAKDLYRRMRSLGCTFTEGLVALALDGWSNLRARDILGLGAEWLVLCDALDEAGGGQELICEGLVQLSERFPDARIIATTRPIGYTSGLLRAWRHYDLQPLETDKVLQHLERLIEAAVTQDEQRARVLSFAKTQVSGNPSAKIAARSPLLLGLMASLLIKGIKLGDSKTQLYERLFRQLATARSSAVEGGVSLATTTLSTFLDVLALELMRNPTGEVSQLLDRCAAEMGAALGEPALRARATTEECLTYWERVGMVERLNHPGIEALTFIHKTLAEYAAARRLGSVPHALATAEIVARIDDKAWWQVLVFATSFGLAEEVLHARLKDVHTLSYSQVREGLSILADADVLPSRELQTQLLAQAIVLIQSPIAREANVIGAELLRVTERCSDEIARTVIPLTEHNQAWTRFAAWSCLASIPDYQFDDATIRRLADDYKGLVEATASAGFSTGFYFDLGASPSHQADILRARIAREVLARFPSEAMIILLPVVSERNYGTFGGAQKLARILTEYGHTGLVEILTRPLSDAFRPFANMFGPNRDRPIETFVRALHLQLPVSGVATPIDASTPMWNLSGVLCATSVWKETFGTAWPRGIPHEDEAIQETLRGCVMASGVDPSVLSRELAACVRALSAAVDPICSFVFEHTEDVDIEMDWKAAEGLDLHKLEHALHYESAWVVNAAANLLETNADERELAGVIERVLASGTDYALWAAAALTTVLPESIGTELILKRLEAPLVDGIQYVYGQLAKIDRPLDERLMKIIRTGLLGFGPLTAEAATRVAEKHVDNPEIATLLQQAFDLWCTKEEPYPVGGGVIPKSPRASLLNALLKCSDFDKNRLLRYVADARTDVADTSLDALLTALRQGEMWEALIEGVASTNIPPKVLDRALKAGVPLDEAQVGTICALLTNIDVAIRRTAVRALHPKYLSPSAICSHASALLSDFDPEIRETARRLITRYDAKAST